MTYLTKRLQKIVRKHGGRDLMIKKFGKGKGEDTNLQVELESNLNTVETRLALALEKNDHMVMDLVLLN